MEKRHKKIEEQGEDMRLYFVRHGQSENNLLWEKNGSSKGRSDDPLLTEIGKEQARAAGWFLKNVAIDPVENRWDSNGKGITHLYCSLMLRAVMTGTIIAEELGLPLVAWKDIHEGGGIYREDEDSGERIGLAGKPRAYFEEHHPNLVLPDDINPDGWWNRPFEERMELPGRAQKFLQDLLRKHGGSNDWVAVVSHGDFYQRVLATLLRLPKRYFHRDFPERTCLLGEDGADRFHGDNLPENQWFLINNAAVTRIDINEEYIHYVYMNRNDFLPDNMIT